MKRRTFITTLALGSAGLSVRALSKTSGATFVVAHGAWSAGWAWKKMHPLLTAAGHRLFTPTYTGLGERAHLADPSNSLETHINDVLGVLTYEDLRDVILVGHSYGGWWRPVSPTGPPIDFRSSSIWTLSFPGTARRTKT